MRNNKIRAFLAVTAIILSFLAAGCKQNEIIEIREKMFATQVDDIYMNTADYLGKTIKLEGIFLIRENNGEPVFYVIRHVIDECCGNGLSGFEVRLPKTQSAPAQIPEDDSWVEAAGLLSEYEEGYRKFLYLELTSIAVLDKRGMEFVTR